MSQARKPVVASAASPAVEGEASVNEDFKGEMLSPSAANKNSIRILGIAAAVLAAARGTGFLSTQGAAFVHLISYSVNLGMITYVTFIAGLTMFKNLPRQTFGRLQSKLFPQYFALSVTTLILQLATLAYGLPIGLQREQLTSLGIALLGSLANCVYVEPTATKMMLDRYELENSSGPKDQELIKKMKKQFGAYHGASSLLNLIVLVAIVSHGWWLGSHLVLV
jgi:hypothetical protein